MEDKVRYKRINVFIISIMSLIIGIIGIYQINISGSIIEDMPKKSSFFKDILFFDKEFNGIVPIEVIIDTKRRWSNRLSTLKELKLEKYINDTLNSLLLCQ